MSRRVAIELSVVAALAAVVVILFLNHLEVDEYPAGVDPKSAAELGDLPSWLIPELVHPCDVCKGCAHRFEATECRLAATVLDHDGWYRLFWAGSETYVYDDAALLGAALRNSTAEFVGGTWTIRGRYVPKDKPAAHECAAAVDQVDLRYRLRRGSYPGPGDPLIDPSGMLPVPLRILWFRYPFPPDRVDDFWWELENPDTFAGATRAPCACGARPAQEQTQEQKKER